MSFVLGPVTGRMMSPSSSEENLTSITSGMLYRVLRGARGECSCTPVDFPRCTSVDDASWGIYRECSKLNGTSIAMSSVLVQLVGDMISPLSSDENGPSITLHGRGINVWSVSVGMQVLATSVDCDANCRCGWRSLSPKVCGRAQAALHAHGGVIHCRYGGSGIESR